MKFNQLDILSWGCMRFLPFQIASTKLPNRKGYLSSYKSIVLHQIMINQLISQILWKTFKKLNPITVFLNFRAIQFAMKYMIINIICTS